MAKEKKKIFKFGITLRIFSNSQAYQDLIMRGKYFHFQNFRILYELLATIGIYIY